MLGRVRGGDRAKSAWPHVQGDARDLVALGLQRGEKLLGEVQTRRGSRDRAWLAGVDRL